jgi:flagellar basal-body rod protein FlgC
MSTIGPALSGLMAATTRLDVSAQNTANAQTPGYRPQAVVQTATASGVATAMRPQQPSQFFAYQPDAPASDAQGQVAMPAVDPGVEMANQMQALNQFKANLQSLLAGDEMFKTALKIV